MIKKVIFTLLGIISFFILIFSYFWTYHNDATFVFLINSPLTTFFTAGDQADPDTFYDQIATHQNPPDYFDNFDGDTFGPAWTFVGLNGKGIVTSPPLVHAANAEIIDGNLVLSVLHDPDFEQESAEYVAGQMASEQYNNAFVIGLGGFAPTFKEDIVVEARFRVSPNYGHTTGIWIEEDKTIDNTGRMTKPFRSVGYSFLGRGNNSPFRGNQLEAVVGFVPVCAKNLDVYMVETDYNTLTFIWTLRDAKTMQVDLYINGQSAESCIFPAFYPGEIQLWADNYKVDGFTTSFENVPLGTIDQIYFDYVAITTVDK